MMIRIFFVLIVNIFLGFSVEKAQETKGGKTYFNLKQYLIDTSDLSKIYDLGIQFKQCRNPLLKEDKPKSLNAAFECFKYIVNQLEHLKEEELKENDKCLLIKAYCELGIYLYETKAYPNAYSKFKTAAYLGSKKAKEYCNFMVFHEGSIDNLYISIIIGKILNEVTNISQLYQLGIKNKLNEGPEFRYNNEASLNAALLCFYEILDRLKNIDCIEDKSILQDTYYQIGIIKSNLGDAITGKEFLLKAKDLGSAYARELLEQQVEN